MQSYLEIAIVVTINVLWKNEFHQIDQASHRKYLLAETPSQTPELWLDRKRLTAFESEFA